MPDDKVLLRIGGVSAMVGSILVLGSRLLSLKPHTDSDPWPVFDSSPKVTFGWAITSGTSSRALLS